MIDILKSYVYHLHSSQEKNNKNTVESISIAINSNQDAAIVINTSLFEFNIKLAIVVVEVKDIVAYRHTHSSYIPLLIINKLTFLRSQDEKLSIT